MDPWLQITGKKPANNLQYTCEQSATNNLQSDLATLFFPYKNHVYKNIEAQKCPFFKNIVVILLVAISISFEPQDEI